MRIGVVAYEMEGRRSGVGRYLEGLLQGLVALDPSADGRDWRWILFFKGDPVDAPLLDSLRGDSRFDCVFDGRPDARPIVWEQTRLPFVLPRHDLDFLFSPAYSLPPFTGVQRMLTLHDLSFEHLPEEFAWRERWRRRHLARLAARRCERVLTDTETVARDIVATYDVPRSRIGVLPLAVEETFFQAAEADPDLGALDELGVRKPYLLHLGSLLPRRRIGLTLDAFARLAEQRGDLQLVLAGADRLPDPHQVDRRIRRLGLEDRVVRVPWVPEASLAPLYAAAEASLYLSTYEGYGLPPLESLAAGTPAVVSGGLALDDLWPDYPYRVQVARDGARDRPVDELVGALRRVLDDGWPDPMAGLAHKILRRLSWRRSAAQLVDEIRIARGELAPPGTAARAAS